MTQRNEMSVDVVIFGGGVAGLWILEALARGGWSAVLLESAALGSGQTIASQGILHGGLKYTLGGWLDPAAAAIREMPGLWRECLADRRWPHLSATRIRAAHCYLWRTDDLRGQLGMVGARAGLRVAPVRLAADERPSALRRCPGSVFRLDEMVVDPVSLCAALHAPNALRILKIDAQNGLRWAREHGNAAIELSLPDRPALRLRPRAIVLAAGAGNAALRGQLGLAGERMQRRPLHMLLIRGDLPELNGHCVDGARTRVTITSETDHAGRRVWQVGGQLAEDGVARSASELIQFARGELAAVLPGVDLHGAQWGAYRVDRAELATPGGRRPDSVSVLEEGDVLTCWPTKLALAPHLAEEVRRRIERRIGPGRTGDPPPADWPRPTIAEPPWEDPTAWSPAS